MNDAMPSVTANPWSCVVCIDYLPPSVRHVPWLLPVAGMPALGRLLMRLSAGEGPPGAGPSTRWVVTTDAARSEILGTIAREHGWETLVEPNCLPAELFARVARMRRQDDLVVYPGTSIAPDCTAAMRLLCIHRARAYDATLADDALLDGLVPLVIRASSADRLATRCLDAIELRGLSACLRKPAVDPGLRVGLQSWVSLADGIDEGTLPPAPLLDDCWTRIAVERAFARNGGSADRTFAQVLKPILAACIDEVPPIVPPGPRPSPGVSTVVFASMRTAFSGGEESLFTLIANLDRSRWRPVVITPFETYLVEKLRRAGIVTHVAGWDYSLLTARNLAYCDSLLGAYGASLVHVDALPNPALMTTARLRGVPLVGHLRVVPRDAISSFAHMPDRIICVSNHVAEGLSRFTVARERLMTIHNAVEERDTGDTGRRGERGSRRERWGISRDAFVLACVSRITPGKKLEVLFDALEHVRREEPRVHAVLVGEAAVSDWGYACQLRRQIDKRDLGVTWVGFDPDIADVLAAIDTLVLTSTHEAFPRCLIEALAAGVVAVAPDAGGSVESIDPGESGLLFPADSVQGLAATLLEIVRNAPLRDRIRNRARQRAREFRVGRQVEQVQGLYETLVTAQHHVASDVSSHSSHEAVPRLSPLVKRAHLVVLIGNDGAGKTTQAHRLVEWLEGRRQRAILHPNESLQPVKQALHAVSRDLGYENPEGLLGPETCHLAYAILKWNTMARLDGPLREAGAFVVMDRYAYCHIASMRAQGLAHARVVERLFSIFPEPDLIVYLDVTPETARRRMEARGLDRELQSPTYLERHARAYWELEEARRFVRIDGERPADDVAEELRSQMRRRFPHLD
jgi:dTMP kinase